MPEKNKGGRPTGRTMPCGWGCGELLTARSVRPHFASCSRRDAPDTPDVKRCGVEFEVSPEVAAGLEHLAEVARGRQDALMDEIDKSLLEIATPAEPPFMMEGEYLVNPPTSFTVTDVSEESDGTLIIDLEPVDISHFEDDPETTATLDRSWLPELEKIAQMLNADDSTGAYEHWAVLVAQARITGKHSQLTPLLAIFGNKSQMKSTARNFDEKYPLEAK